MNVNIYNKGINRLFYKAEGFVENRTVTVIIWNPSLVKSGPYDLEELEGGLYYFDFNFDRFGTWAGLFYENEVEKASATFRVNENPGLSPLIQHIGEL